MSYKHVSEDFISLKSFVFCFVVFFLISVES